MKSSILWLLFLWILAAVVHAQNGFISIDCGAPEGSNYTDAVTGIYYTSDAGYIDSGENKQIQSSLISPTLPHQYQNLRSFPDGDRNCYTLTPVVRGNKYLVRASFMHGNYDGAVTQARMPTFDLFLGVNLWTPVAQTNASFFGKTEIITVAVADFVSVCLVRKSGNPFISALELRPLPAVMYNATTESQALVLYNRYDVGSASRRILRYTDDVYDRIWAPFNHDIWRGLNASSAVNNNVPAFQPPAAVLSTAVTPASNTTDILYLNWTADSPQDQFHVYRHIAEVELLNDGDIREFTSCISGYGCFGPVRPRYLIADTVYTITPFSGRKEYSCFFRKTAASTLPPIFNAIEIYTVAMLSTEPTSTADFDAIMNIKSACQVKKNWMGDPCVPKAYTWEGVGCSYNDPNPPTIVTLNLSASGLSGKVVPSIGRLTSLRSLDLSGNNLTGEIPDFLQTLPSLTTLILSSNNFTGSVPSMLLQRSQNGTLLLSLDNNLITDNSIHCSTSSCKKKKSIGMPLAISVSVIALILLTAAFLYFRKSGNRCGRASLPVPVTRADEAGGPFNLENRKFSFAEVTTMTDSFIRVLGKGGFGTVYHGQMSNGTQVAVKILSENFEGSKEFQIEAQLLTRVYHRNLVHLIGYCAEGNKMALILEYMPKGNLATVLSDNNMTPLTWIQRLQIALDIAQGLEYLHVGCKPPIIHRDIKATNILLNERLEAKIADFGVSKVFSNEEFTHVSTAVKGTHGYLDPEYCVSSNLNEKSDVYSFGIVLLELLTGLSAIIQTSNSEKMNIVDWVRPLISKGDIRSIIDPRINGNFDINSAWKSVEIAIECTAQKSEHRPTMSMVISDLKDCLGAGNVSRSDTSLTSAALKSSSYDDSIFRPLAR